MSEASKAELDFIEEQGLIAATGHGWPKLSVLDAYRLRLGDQLELMRHCLEVMREGDRAYAWAPFWRVAGLLLDKGRDAMDSMALMLLDAMTDEALAYAPASGVDI